MTTYTDAEWRAKVAAAILDGSADVQTDNVGQLVVYTGLFEWLAEDGKNEEVRDEPQPEYGN